jgi:hypothetical protein
MLINWSDSTFAKNHTLYHLRDAGRRDELIFCSDESNIGEAGEQGSIET